MSITFVFGPKGTLESTRGLITNFQGRVDGADLVAQIASATGKPQEVRIHAEGDKLTYTVDGSPEEWIRLGGAIAGAPAWAGAWAYDHLGPPGKKQKKPRLAGMA